MSEPNPTNETSDSITPRAVNRSLAGNLHGSMASSNSHITNSDGQSATSTLVSRRFSPTAPEFVSGATAHPSRGPADNMIQSQVSQTWQGADTGGVLLKPTLSVESSRTLQEAPLSSLRDPHTARPYSRWTPCSENPPTNFVNRGDPIRDNSRSPQNSSYGNLPLQNPPYAASQDIQIQNQTRAFNALHDRLFPSNPPRVSQDIRAEFDHRYLHGNGIWNSPPKRLQSLSVSPGRRDSANSGLSASASYHSSTSNASIKPVNHANIGTDGGARNSGGGHGLATGLHPGMDDGRQQGRSETRAVSRNETNRASSKNNHNSKSRNRGSSSKNRKTGNNTPKESDPTERSASMALTAENVAWTTRPGNGKWKKQAKSRTTTDSRSHRDEGEHRIPAHQDAQYSVEDSNNHRQGADAGGNRGFQAQHQSLHILNRNQPLPATNSGIGGQQQHLVPHTTIGITNLTASGWPQQPASRPGPGNTSASERQQQPVFRPVTASTGVSGVQQQQPFAPHVTRGLAMIAASGGRQLLVPSYPMSVPGNTGAIGGQQQSAALQLAMGSGNMRASGPPQQPIPPHATMNPTWRTAVLQSNVPAPNLVNGQKYFMRPGLRGSTTIWAYDGIVQDQLYFCSMGEDGSVMFMPTSSSDHGSVQQRTTLPIGQSVLPNGPGPFASSRHPLPDFGPIGPPTRGHSYGATTDGQNHLLALSHPYNPRLDANHEGPRQAPIIPPTWSLPQSPIRTDEWTLRAAHSPQPQSQQGLLTYPSPTALTQLVHTQLHSSQHGRTESETTQIWNPSRQQLAGPGMGHERFMENVSFTPTRSSVLDRYQLPITEISNVSPRALAPRSGTFWMGSSSSPNLANPHVPTISNMSWETPGVEGLSPMTSPTPMQLIRYRQFQDMTFSHVQHGHPNAFGDQIARNGKPSFELAMSPEFLPFVEATKLMKPAEWGVIKIGSIPYACTKQEILAFLGKNAKIITPEMGPAIHIMMDRTSGKTLDAYVEFLSHADAFAFATRLNHDKDIKHRQIKVADRHCTVEVSSQAVLMKELFPKAKNVQWNGQIPVISEPVQAVPFNSGFKSFISREELLTLVKHAETPQRSQCSSKSVSRTYENMISILYKFPWFAVKHYSIADRDAIYEAVKKQLHTLGTAIEKAACQRAADPKQPPSELTQELLGDLLQAGLKAPGFSEQQKWRLWQGSLPFSLSIARISPLSGIWPWLVLSRKYGTEEDLVREYAQIHHNGRLLGMGNLAGASPLFEGGALVCEGMDQETSMEEAGALEWGALEIVLGRALE